MVKRALVRFAKILLAVALLSAALALPRAARAQGDGDNSPTYVVRPGDTLSDIAFAFGVDVRALMAANHITSPNSLRAGQTLVIPGLEGVTGRLIVQKTAFGDSLFSVSRALHIPTQKLARLNHLVSPFQFYAGKPIVVPESAKPAAGERLLLGNESLLDAALRSHQSAWALVFANGLPARWDALSGDVLIAPAGNGAKGTFSAFPSGFAAMLKPGEWVQGRTGEVVLSAVGAEKVVGEFDGDEMPFFRWKAKPNGWVGLKGIHALADPGIYPLSLTVMLADGRTFGFAQAVRVVAGDYYYEKLNVSPSLLNPELNRKEERFLEQKTAAATPLRYWEGKFAPPEKPPFSDCHPSYFGARRNYNSGAFFWYHTGLDFCGRVGTPIYAPAGGKVVFVGKTEIHGNVTIIDHGWGVYTLYCHQSAALVKVGQTVHKGDLIGKVGRTGRVTGPHLHWEVRVDGTPVDPQEWLDRVFP